jgi:glycosyltransferase involved in cell wall biosynthesis
MRSPSILIVSYYLAPQAAVGGRRPTRMARELAKRGWRVEVLTTRERVNLPHDASLPTAGDGVRLRRTRTLEPRLLVEWLRARRASSAPDAAPPPAPGGGGARAALSRAFHALFSIPDPRAGWLPCALLAGLARGRRPDLVLATAPPFTSFVAGALLAAAFRVPLVADYRDAWTTLEAPRGVPRWRARLDRRIERACLARAALVLTTTSPMARGLAALTQAEPVCLPNGYDAEEFAKVEAYRFELPTLVYAGSFYASRSATPLLAALRRMRDLGAGPPQGFALHILGITADETRARAAEMGLAGSVVSEGFLPLRDAIARMKGAHALLLLVGSDHAEMIPAKLYDYLAAERPIVALVPPRSAVAAELERLGTGVVVDSGDVVRIAEALSELLRRPPARVPLSQAAQRFDSSVMGDELDRLLRPLVPGGHGLEP